MSVIEMKPVRERILDAATERYYAEGIRAVSADKLIEAAHVSKVTFYRYFPTKDDLVTAYLAARAAEEEDAITAQRREHPDDPGAVLRWYADMVGQVGCSPGFRGCPFINAAAELPEDDHPGRRVIAEHRAWLVSQIGELLDQLGVADSAVRAEQLMMLRDGAMVSGYVGRAPEQVADALVAGGRAIIGR
ncbi:TetR/AcrR family transcriptional regulator [Aeromicrobium chenweiae]|uniref:TetR family transcriptional regulator n=1 Tax=Aeromicrobium chenweiae TaxID=2079793 RepID=A0A2S0WQJ9_9ACTN|nr:TetR/AcrR family transcriptional regulator [Aeromicrobium chenweiae]AWB93635.1 TetR family transcriptional regulator [Aeromicrobium chenweiae]TGN33284.1 TetR/AcrR family transcriptional regulator [Aeromicrobium chenweiae]